MEVWNSHDFIIMDFGDLTKIMLRFIFFQFIQEINRLLTN